MTSIGEWVDRLIPWKRRDVALEPDASAELTFGPDDVRPATWDADLELSLAKLVTDTETRASGRVQVLTLAHLRSELGDGWDTYKSKVILIAETTIGRMIGKGNTYIPQDEDSWLLLMPSMPEAEAEACADAIARSLGEKLIGARFVETEAPLPQTAKVDLAAAFNPDGTFNSAALKMAVKRARIVLAAKDVHRASAELDKNAKPAKAINFATTASFAQASLFPKLTLTYRPQWDSATESFSTFVLRAFTDMAEPVFGPGVPEHIQKALNDATIIDLAKAAFADFTAMTQKNMRATYVLPVPFPVMTRKLGAVFMRALSALPQKERLLHMRIELVNVPPQTPVGTLVDVREIFRGRVKDVAFLMDLAAIQDNVMALDHVSLGVESRTDAGLPDTELVSLMNSFRRRAGARRSYIMGLRSRTLAAAAVQMGYDEISGTGIIDDRRDLPDRISVAYKQDLLRPT
jgi:hypothetical protein